MAYFNEGISTLNMIGRRKKRPQIPPFVLHRFPPDHPIHQSYASCSDDTESEEDE